MTGFRVTHASLDAPSDDRRKLSEVCEEIRKYQEMLHSAAGSVTDLPVLVLSRALAAIEMATHYWEHEAAALLSERQLVEHLDAQLDVCCAALKELHRLPLSPTQRSIVEEALTTMEDDA